MRTIPHGMTLLLLCELRKLSICFYFLSCEPGVMSTVFILHHVMFRATLQLSLCAGHDVEKFHRCHGSVVAKERVLASSHSHVFEKFTSAFKLLSFQSQSPSPAQPVDVPSTSPTTNQFFIQHTIRESSVHVDVDRIDLHICDDGTEHPNTEGDLILDTTFKRRHDYIGL